MGERALRVGFLIDRWEPRRGGAERALALLAAHLEARGCDVRAFALSASDGAPGTFHAVRPGLLRGALRASRERELGRLLVGAARDAGCDVTIGIRHLPEVDVYWPHDGSHYASLADRRRARGRPGAPAGGGRHRVFLDFERALLVEGGARRVLCVSELVERELAELYPACRERLFVVPNGVDLERFHPRERAGRGGALRRRLEIEPQVPLLVFAGRDPVRKGLAQLLAALEQSTDREWRLLVAGVRHPARWKRIALRHGLGGERVLFEPEVSAPELFAAADLVVVPTWRDTSLLVLLEALASGTPVVTTARAGASVAITTPEAGVVLDDPGDVPALRAAVDDWLARIVTGRIDRERIRAQVLDRGQEAWLAELERHVVAAARG